MTDRSYTSIMPRPRNEKLRETLLDQGVSVFIEHGYHGTGIKEVLDPAGVPKGSFYNYFKSKEDFGAAVVGHFAKRLDAQLAEMLRDESVEALESIGAFLDQVGDHHEQARQGCLVGNLGAELGDSSEQIRQALSEAMHGWRDRFERTIDRGQREGTIRGDIPAAVLSDFLLNAFEGSLIRTKIEKSTKPLEQLRSLVGSFFRP